MRCPSERLVVSVDDDGGTVLLPEVLELEFERHEIQRLFHPAPEPMPGSLTLNLYHKTGD